MISCVLLFSFFFFNDTPTTEIYTLSLHDALPISRRCRHPQHPHARRARAVRPPHVGFPELVRPPRSEEHTSELQSPYDLVCRLLLEKKKEKKKTNAHNSNTDIIVKHINHSETTVS